MRDVRILWNLDKAAVSMQLFKRAVPWQVGASKRITLLYIRTVSCTAACNPDPHVAAWLLLWQGAVTIQGVQTVGFQIQLMAKAALPRSLRQKPTCQWDVQQQRLL